MAPIYPTARDLMEKLGHCSACGDTSPEVKDGYTLCCGKRHCTGADPAVAQGPCCEAVAERLEHEQAAGGAPVRAVDVKAAPAAARPARRRRKTAAPSPRIDETQELRAPESDANLVSHPGGNAPQPDDTKEPAMTESRATKAVFTALFKDALGTFTPVGYTFGKERELYETLAKAYLGDRTELKAKTIDGADWDAIFEHFVTDEESAADAPTVAPAPAPEAPAPAPTAPAEAPAEAPRRKGARESQGAATVSGWELLYDKPKQNCEVGRMYVGPKATYALICKTHAHVHPLARLTAERTIRTAGGWCPECSK